MNHSPAAFIQIDPVRKQSQYSRHIFGQFIEHFHREIYGGIFEPNSPLADHRGFRLDVIEALRELKVPNVRWPGGCFVSAYHWLDGVGPDRAATYDPAWRVTDPNTFGTDEFVEWCRELGADPYICTNAGTGTAEEMAAWLEYANRPTGSKWSDLRAKNGHPEPYAVPFWSIGNENYGDWEIGAKTGSEWARFVTESAKLLRRYDPDVRLLAAAIEEPQWALPLLEQAGKYLDYISIHGYWDHLNQVDEPSSYLACMALTLRPGKQIDRARALIEASGQGHVKIAFDEWNLRGWHHPSGNDVSAISARDRNDLNSTYTMADAVFSAAFLNSCLRNSDIVGMANLAPTINARGPLYVHAGGVVKRTTFHVLSMYANLLGSRVVDSAVSSINLDTGSGDVPLIDGIATANDQGRIQAVLINKSDAMPATVRVNLGGTPVTGSRSATVLSGPAADAYNDIEKPDVVTPQQVSLVFENGLTTIPPHSITICDLGTSRSLDDPFEWNTDRAGDWSSLASR